jgi:hypothetical protein
VLGPLIVNAIADTQKAAGKHGPDLYIVSFVVVIALLIVGLICNELIGQVATKHHEPAAPDDALLTPEAGSRLQPQKQR